MSNSFAIAGVTAVLQFYLREALGSFPPGAPSVSAVAPDIIQQQFNGADVPSQVNLFLHQVTYNPGWRNQYFPSLAADGRTRLDNPPLALDLHYLLTAYASEDYHAEALLGIAVLMLHENPVLARADISRALANLDATNDLASTLATCALPQQIEQMKITPATLGREEMAWLWTALKADYRPTFPFLVSVVLIQPELGALAGPPVLSHRVAAQPNLLASFPRLTDADPPAGKSAVNLGDLVVVEGTQLSGTQSILLSTAQQNVQQALAIAGPGDASFQFTVPNPPPPPPGSDPTDLPAGVYVLSATVKTASDVLTTNSVPLAIAPRITSAIPATIASGVSVSLTVSFAPFARPSQQVALLIGGQQAPPDKLDTATETLSFTFKPLLATSGPVPVWLRVDGVDSQIVDTSSLPPKYSGPLTQVT
jgi:hypothetical protein